MRPLREFWSRHPSAQAPLRSWYTVVLGADWASLADVRKTYAHADSVRSRSGETLPVFNIAGNKYRLIARIKYEFRLVNVRAVLTHAEYDLGKWKG